MSKKENQKPSNYMTDLIIDFGRWCGAVKDEDHGKNDTK